MKEITKEEQKHIETMRNVKCSECPYQIMAKEKCIEYPYKMITTL